MTTSSSPPPIALPVSPPLSARHGRRSLAILFALVIALLVAAAAIAAVLMMNAFDRELRPVLDEKAEALGRSVAGQIERLVAAGNPLNRLEGMTPFLENAIERSGEVRHIQILGPSGRVLYEAGSRPDGATRAVAVALELEGALASAPEKGRGATIELVLDPSVAAAQKRAVGADILIVILVAAALAVELLLLAGTLLLIRPLALIEDALERAAAGDVSWRLPVFGGGLGNAFAQSWNTALRGLEEAWRTLAVEAADIRRTLPDAAAQRLGALIADLGARVRLGDPDRPRALGQVFPHAVRAPVFLFMLAEEMSRSFLPLYIRDLYEPIAGVPVTLIIGLPITVFMAAVAISTPIAGQLADRYGLRRTFIAGTAPLVVGYIGTALAYGVWDLMVWRALAGIGYAALYIAGQGYIADTTTPANRTRGMALFMGAVFAAVVCGPALGGVLADLVGPRGTFLVSGASAAISLLLILWLLGRQPDAPTIPRPRPRLADAASLLANPGFAALALLAAVPGKIALTGFLFYLAPLHLAKLGNSPSEAGRVLMIYGAATLLLTPLAAVISDRFRLARPLVATGGLLAGLGLMAVLGQPDTVGMALATLLLGIGHAASIAPQLALVPEMCAAEVARMGMTTVLAVFRLIERVGSVVGPLIAALLLDQFGFTGATSTLGGLIALSALGFAAISLTRPTPSRPAPEPEVQP